MNVSKEKVSSKWMRLDDYHGLAYDKDRSRITFRVKSEGRWTTIAHLYLVDPTLFQEFLVDDLPQSLANLFKNDPVEEAVEKLLAEWRPSQTISSRDLWERFKEQASPVVERLLEKGLVEPERSEFDSRGNFMVYYKRALEKNEGT